MSKRSAAIQLTQETCEEEDEVVEAGVFELAQASDLKTRVIKKAKRTLTGNSEPNSTPFSSFSGFGSFPKKPISTSGFSFAPQPKPAVQQQNMTTMTTETTMTSDANNKAYYRQLEILNQGFLKWVQGHLEKNPAADFTPVCKDYQKHVEDLKVKFNFAVQEPKSPKALSAMPAFSFNSAAGSLTTNHHVDSNSSPVTSTVFSSVPLGGSSSFNFASSVTDALSRKNDTANATNEEETYQPPVTESVRIEETDAVFSEKCKLFYQKDGNYVEKGVGYVNLKPCQDKAQLLIRADTSLGNILLNVMLTPSIPVERMGKNNVMIVCLPNPPLQAKEEPKATPFLIRVKTEDLADKLHEEIKKLIS